MILVNLGSRYNNGLPAKGRPTVCKDKEISLVKPLSESRSYCVS